MADPFSDIADSIFRADIIALYEQGIVKGYSDGTFRPEQQVTRGEMAAFLRRVLDVPVLTATVEEG